MTRNSETRNIPVWVSPNIWRLGRIRDTKFSTDVSNEKLLNTAKCQCYRFYRSTVIKGKPTGVGGKITHLPTRATQIRVKTISKYYHYILIYNQSYFKFPLVYSKLKTNTFKIIFIFQAFVSYFQKNSCPYWNNTQTTRIEIVFSKRNL